MRRLESALKPAVSDAPADAFAAECGWDGILIKASPGFLRLFGLGSLPDSCDFFALLPADSREPAEHLWHAVQSGRSGHPVPLNLSGKSEEDMHLLHIAPMQLGQGDRRRYAIKFEPHNSQYDLLNALESTEIRFRFLFENTSDLVIWLSLDLDILGGNPAFETLTGLEMESFYSGHHTWEDWVATEDLPALLGALRGTIESGTTGRVAAQVRGRSGICWHEFSIHPILRLDKVRGLFCVGRDIHRLKLAEQSLNTQAQSFRDRQAETLRRLERMKGLASTLAGVKGGKVDFICGVRDSLAALFPGLAVAVDTHPAAGMPNPNFSGSFLDAPVIRLLFEARVPVLWSHPEEAPSNLEAVSDAFLGVGIFGAGGEPVGALFVVSDEPRKFSPEDVDTLLHASLLLASHLSQWKQEEERDRQERRGLQDQKMEALGRLASGLAHDFNNLISIILNYANYAAGALPEEGKAAEDIRVVVQTADQAADLTRKLMQFARSKPAERIPLDINQLVVDTCDLLSHGIRKDIRLLTELQKTLPSVAGDSTQIRQVVMNLVLNAAQALGEHAGEIRITTRLQEVPRPLRERMGAPRHKEAVLIEVSDTGPGIPAALLPHVFEAFQTTRREGVGLGLSIVHSVATQHGGTVDVESEPGKGATFRVWLPPVEP